MKHSERLVCELLALLCLALAAVLLILVRVRLAPAEEAPIEPTPSVTPAPTPCVHRVYENGVCVDCGYACPHAWEEGACALCGLGCPHESHEEASGRCTLCGSVVPHRLRGGKCLRCGMTPRFTETPLPESMTQPCPEAGRVETVDLGPYLPREDGRTVSMPAAVYLPYGYDEAGERRYNLVIALHGAYSNEHGMIDESHFVKGAGTIRFQDLYDNLIYSREVEPFIVLSLNTCAFAGEEYWTEDGCDTLARELRERVLPFAAEEYHTYAADGSFEALSAARGHIAVVGLSNGSLYALRSALADNLALFGGFGCFSGNYPETTAAVLATLGDPAAEAWPIHCFFTGAGTTDFQQRNTEMRFHEIVEACEGLSEGVNAFHTDIEGAHNWATWGAETVNCLRVLFQEI